MIKDTKKTKARLPRGFLDQTTYNIKNLEAMLKTIAKIYYSYGFEPLETPIFEYSEVLGKFLPDQERPNAGVFSLQDDDEQWLSLRYDLTAPLARYVAENYATLPKPYRSYRYGYVFRNEKPGPGRFRQFMQFDADIVGAPDSYADAEICMMAADLLQALGFAEGEYNIRINNRKILDSILEDIGLNVEGAAEKKLTVLRAIDKWDKFGEEGVALLLGKGRLDESGDFTKGAELSKEAIAKILAFMQSGCGKNAQTLKGLAQLVQHNKLGEEGIEELTAIYEYSLAAGYENSIKIDPSVVRGLEYYTGPVFEAELLLPVLNDQGQRVAFGSIGGGGRYDTLITRFREENIPATGFSIGVSRLLSAMHMLEKYPEKRILGPVVILAMDRDKEAMKDYQKISASLRQAGIRNEVYLGTSGMKAQMKYADRRNAPCVIIQGDRERLEGKIQIKDLIMGSKLAQEITDNQLWRENHPAQKVIDKKDLVQEVQDLLSYYKNY